MICGKTFRRVIERQTGVLEDLEAEDGAQQLYIIGMLSALENVRSYLDGDPRRLRIWKGPEA